MFERYTEKARRVIFFARCEASQYGSPCIETEHLLLGLLRENRGLAQLVAPEFGSGEDIRREIEAGIEAHERISTSVEVPLTQDCKRILNFAAEEADRLGHKHIGTEHLLLGILRQEKCKAAVILANHGASLSELRGKLMGQPVGELEYATTRGPMGAAVDELVEAWRTRDVKKLARMFAAHGQLWDTRGEQWLTPPQVEKGLASHFASPEAIALAPDVRDVKFVTSEVSVATLIWKPQVEQKKHTPAALRMVLVLCDAHSGWLIVSAHLALLPTAGSKTGRAC
jgi:Clp amino terminal domain, pathogenicity island component/SnoaL-like domain